MSATAIPKVPRITPSRRDFLKSSALAAGTFLLGAYIPFPDLASAQADGPAGPYDPNFFVKISPDNLVTVISKHFEMGQGVTTGLCTLVAEELDADWSKVGFEFAPVDARYYNNLLFGPFMGTGGSSSMAEAWVQMRKVGAAARLMLMSAAAAKWNVPASELETKKSVVTHAKTNHRATYGELAADAMHQPVPADVTLKTAKGWELIGAKIPRLDSVQKTTGSSIFAIDIRRPGMLTAVVKHPDVFGGKVVSFDSTEAKKVDGVVDVFQIPSGVAVLAKDTWSAIEGRAALKVTWDTSKAETRSTSDIFNAYREQAKGQGFSADKRGDAAQALSRAAKTHEAEFTFPYLCHAPMEPLNCVMEFRGDSAELWSGCQLQNLDQFVASQVLGLKPDQVKINTLLGGGSFGRRGNPLCDWVIEVSQISKTINGRAPVHLVWTREDDIKGGAYRPMFLHQVKAGVDSNGQISGWHHKIVGQPIFRGTAFEAMGFKNGVDSGTVEGTAGTPYAIPDFSVDAYNADSVVPVTWFRSVGHTHNCHAMETTMDELAHLAGKDPVEFRLALLAKQPRDSAVIRLAAEKGGWKQPLAKGRGRGFAYQFSFGTRVAMISEVSVVHSKLKIERIVAAVDCGTAINPDVVTAQIQGAIGFALCIPLRSQITMKDGVVEQSNFDDYEPTRLREMPKVEVHIVPSSEHPSGIGEPGVPPVAPSIGNAIFAATGKRLRSLPFDLDQLG